MRRIPLTKALLQEMGIDPDRLRLEWVSASEGARFKEVVTEFTEQIRELGPLNLKEWAFDPDRPDIADDDKVPIHDREPQPSLVRQEGT